MRKTVSCYDVIMQLETHSAYSHVFTVSLSCLTNQYNCNVYLSQIIVHHTLLNTDLMIMSWVKKGKGGHKNMHESTNRSYLSILLNTGRGICTYTCGMDIVFSPDAHRFGSYTKCILIMPFHVIHCQHTLSVHMYFRLYKLRTLHDCPSQMNENLLISNSKLTSDSELIWWR